MGKLKLLLASVLLVTATSVMSQTISPYLFGQNIWLDKLYANGIWNNWGEMDQFWDELEDANLKMIRAGGIHYDENIPTNAIYLEWVDEVRAIGAEPMLQISRKSTTQQAKDLITFINVTMGRDVKYWIIGNEPDFHWNISKDPGDPYYVVGAETIKEYTTRISSAIKEVDPTILVVGPETAWMNDTYLSELLGGVHDISGKDANGNYYVDIVTYHQYNDPTAAAVETKMNRFLGYLSTANTNRDADHQLDWAITEFNITTDNDKETQRNKAWSFYAGQYFAEVFGLAMKNAAFSITPWSTHESGGNRVAFDLGMFDAGPGYEPRSSYHHVSLLANSFSGEYADGVTNQADVSAFGCVKNSGYSVMVLNKGTSAMDFTLRLNSETIAGFEDLKINIDADLAENYAGTIAGEETLLLEFNALGQLVRRCSYTKTMADNSTFPVCENIGVAQSPYNGVRFPIPGTIEAEEYDLGGQGVSYSDITAGNEGGEFRNDNVDIGLANASGDYNVGWTDAGEWLEYSVNVTSSGQYEVGIVVANEFTGEFHIEFDGVDVTNTVTSGPTGGWQVWDTLVAGPFSLTEGEAIVRLSIDQGPVNIDKMIFVPEGTITSVVDKASNDLKWFVSPNPTNGDVQLPKNTNWTLTDSFGRELMNGEGKQVPMLDLNKGMYFLKVKESVIRIVKK